MTDHDHAREREGIERPSPAKPLYARHSNLLIASLKNIGLFAASAAVAIAFLLFFSYYTSPLSSTFGYDAAFFQLVGSGMTEGLYPYRDFFDMKGPWLFFIEYFGQLVARGRLGAFVIQCASLAVTVFFTIKAATTVRPGGALRAICCLACSLFMLSFTLAGGNLTEELSLPFLMIGTYILLNYLVKRDKLMNSCVHNGRPIAFPRWGAFILGIDIGIVFLIRITNTASLLGLLACVLLVFIWDRNWKGAAISVAFFFFGLVIAIAPVFIYSFVTNTGSDLIYCVFEFCFAYSGESSMSEHLTTLSQKPVSRLSIIACLPVAAVALHHRRCGWRWLLAIIPGLCVLVAVSLGNAYLHYGTLWYPIMALFFFLCAHEREHVDKRSVMRRMAIIAAPCILLIVTVTIMFPMANSALHKSYKEIKYHFTVSDKDRTAPPIEDITSRIPEEDKDSVFCLGGSHLSRFYAIAQIYPCIRYCDWQGHYVSICPWIEDDLINRFNEDPPLWLVAPKKETVLISESLTKLVRERYVVACQNDEYRLLQLSESNSPSGDYST